MKKFASTKIIFCARIDQHRVRRFPLLRSYKAPIALKMLGIESLRTILRPAKNSRDRRRSGVSGVSRQALVN